MYVWVGLLFVLVQAISAQQGIQATFDERGLATLNYNGVQFINVDHGGPSNGQPFSLSYAMINGTQHWGQDGLKTSWDASSLTLTMYYPSTNFSVITAQYEVTNGSDTLKVNMNVQNTGSLVIDSVVFKALMLLLPAPVPAWQSFGQEHNNLDGPNIIPADFGIGLVVLADQDALPKYMAWDPVGSNAYIIRVSTAADGSFLPGADPFTRPINPGSSLSMGFTLYFAPNGTDYLSLVPNELAAYAKQYPSTLTWTDRTPVGQIFMTQPTSSPVANSSSNPRGYMFTPKGVDVNTPDGLKAFQQAAITFAQQSLAAHQQVGATGTIVWDLEGQQYPQPDISYVGSPDLLPVMSPEMDSIADAFFKVFTDAGLRCGMTVRPQAIYFNGTNGPQRVYLPGQQANLMIQKMGYAYKRWGCTIFYVDSNGGPDNADSADYFRETMEALPNILIVPENIATRYYAYTAPLASFLATYKPVHTPALAQAIWPNAFSLTAVNDCPNQNLTNNPNDPNQWAEFVEAVKKGDILSFRGWYDDEPLNSQVTQIYKEAGVPVNQTRKSNHVIIA